MKRRRSGHTLLREVDGHSLIEVVVATSLIVTVLLPLSGLLVYLLTSQQNEPHLVALAIGQQFMEEALYARSYTSEHVALGGGRWRVQRIVTKKRNQVTVVVRVFRRRRPEPLVTLMTVRLLA